jgi:hypothetical protein
LLLGSASALGAFRATPGTPHLELPSGRALKALHPSQETPSKCMIMPSLINLYETQNSCARHFTTLRGVMGIFLVLLLVFAMEGIERPLATSYAEPRASEY